ncbi:hypothetical protein BWZ20_07980 [Winogradskyella sp. J14-2]|nr:hypothetical protein BWZ20_07980 [Winogradskyella sp. J14-2]
MKAYFLFVIFNCLWVFSTAQDNVEFRQLRGNNVPTPSITYAVDKDSIGNIWIATEEGVLKHNSKNYKIYNSYSGLPEIMNNRIKEVFVDTEQRIWIGSQKGISLYNDSLDIFEYIETDEAINPSLIEVIIEDDNHNIWAGGFNGIWKYDEASKRFLRKVSNHNIQALHCLRNKLVFGTPKGVYHYDHKNDKLLEIPLNTNKKNIRYITNIDNQLFIATKTGQLYKINDVRHTVSRINFDFNLSDAITDIIKDTDSTYLLATDGEGIFKLNSKFKKLDTYKENPNEMYSLSSNGIYDIHLDQEGILWIATYGGGLNYFNSNIAPFQNIRHKINDPNSIITNFTRAVSKDANGNFWFGTKKGVSIWNRSSNTWRHLKNLSISNTNEDVIVLSLEPDGDFMWIGTYNEGLIKVNINTLRPIHCNLKLSNNLVEKVYAIHKDSKGNVWAGGIEKDLSVISTKNEVTTYPIQQIKSIIESESGDILIAGRQGVYRVNHNTGNFGLIEELLPDKSDLAYSTINAVLPTKQNTYILATNGEGLLFFNPKNKIIHKLKISSGMPSDIVQGIVQIGANNFWASTTNGLAHIITRKSDTLINVYDKKDGLASTEYNYGSFNKFDDGSIVFGGVDGLTFFNPFQLKKENYQPKLVFDFFKIANKKIEPGNQPLDKHINTTKAIELTHEENALEIGFTGVLHSTPSRVKYSWILEGFDEVWNEPTTKNFATYTNLNPGNYTFKAKAINKYGVPSSVRQLDIKINSPWWATNKAYLLYFLLLIGLIYAIIHFTSVIVKKKNADEQIDFFNNITHEIKTPLTILISSLDNVTEKVGDGEDSKNRIKTTVKRINSLFEQMLNFQKVTSADNQGLDIAEVDVYAHINQRIKNFKPLTEERQINVVFNNDWNETLYFDKDSFDKIMLNLISNAIKYSHENGTITINTSKTVDNHLKIEIIDEGLGIPKDQQKHILKRYFRARNVINSQRAGTGLGLMMVKKLIEKTDGSINFISEENKGTTFTLLLKNFKEEFQRNNTSKNLDSIKSEYVEILEDQTELSEYSDSKILIVEDNDELRGLLSDNLGTYFQIHEAKNGLEGLEVTSTIFPDIILTDLIMPEMDGMEMAKKIKDDISLNHIPVFMLTVLQNSEQKLESIETGIAEYLEKPIDIKYLLARITSTLKWQQQLRKKYVHDSDADTAEIFRSKNDQEFLTKLEQTIVDNAGNNDFSVHDLSASFGMSRTSLYMKLKNLVDLSPQDFIIHTKLKHAKNLLIRGDLSIKEVAYQSGFSNPKYFSTSFKKFYKMTPSAFIESLKKS